MHHAWLLDRTRGHRQGDACLPVRPPRAGAARRTRSRRRLARNRGANRSPRARCWRCRIRDCCSSDVPGMPRTSASGRSFPSTRSGVSSRSSRHTAAGSDWRVVIVDTADELNLNAANALLKVLEEPPRRTVFLLVSAEPGRLLPTIRSRCRTLGLLPLDEADLKRAALKALEPGELEPPEPSDWRQLLVLAAGSPRALADALDGGRARTPLAPGAVVATAAATRLGPGAHARRRAGFGRRRRHASRCSSTLLLQLMADIVRAGRRSCRGHGRFCRQVGAETGARGEACHLGRAVGNSRPRKSESAGAQSRSQVLADCRNLPAHRSVSRG